MKIKDEGRRMKDEKACHCERTREESGLGLLARSLVSTLGITIPFFLICLVVRTASAQVNIPAERLRNCTDDTANWLTHNGNYSGHRYSKLDQLTPANVANIKPAWVFQSRESGKWEC